jgi:hypothetical protein
MSIHTNQTADYPLSALLLRLTVQPSRIIDLAGATAQALVLNLIERGDPLLAAQLRGHAAARPYTVALLREESSLSQITVRVTAVGAAIPRALAVGVERVYLEPALQLGPLNVSAITIATTPGITPWVNAESFGRIQRSAEALGDTITFILASPLLPRHRPLAWRDGPPANAALTPALLFEAMRERWHVLDHAMPVICADKVRVAALQARATNSQLQVASHLQRAGKPSERAVLRGFVGRITVGLGGSPGDHALLRTLAAACFYFGAGVGTAGGMGCIRALPASNF